MMRIDLLRQMQAAENEKLKNQLQELEVEKNLNQQIAQEVESLAKVELESKLAEQELFRKTWDA